LLKCAPRQVRYSGDAAPPQNGASLTSDRFKRWQAESREIERLTPIFVVGPNKCGTTWMYRTLAAHPHVAGLGGETLLWSHRLSAFEGALGEFLRPTTKRFPKHELLEVPVEDFDPVRRQLLDRIILAGLERAGRRADPSLCAFVEKTPGHAQHILAIHRLYPSAKFICCTRDVRDAAVSAWKHFQITNEWVKHQTIGEFALKYLVDMWTPNMRSARYAAQRLPEGRYLEVAYEARHEQGREGIIALLRFLGLDTTDESVDACAVGAAFESFSGGRNAGEEAKHFLRKGTPGDWVNHMTTEFGGALVDLANESLGKWKDPSDSHPIAMPCKQSQADHLQSIGSGFKRAPSSIR
jgi:hypothetical protein